MLNKASRFADHEAVTKAVGAAVYFSILVAQARGSHEIKKMSGLYRNPTNSLRR